MKLLSGFLKSQTNDTGHKIIDNIRLYEKMGYKKFKEEKVTDELVFVYMEKE